MITMPERHVDELLRDARTWEAARIADAMRTQSDDPALRRFVAGVFAIAGRRAALAGIVDPALLAARTSEEVESVLRASPGDPSAFDYAAAATAVSWRGDTEETYRLLRLGAARAIEMQLPHVAIAIDERLAQTRAALW